MQTKEETTGVTKEEWVSTYARRILKLWQKQACPLGVDTRYEYLVEKQLADFFEDPLKRELIESSY